MVTFDESLGVFASSLLSSLDTGGLEAGWMIRDASGRLSFITATPISDEMAELAAQNAFEAAAPYVRADGSVMGVDVPGVESVIANAPVYEQVIQTSGGDVRLKVIDQRIVGADWLETPSSSAGGAPRYVFASIKGGVGRTTALAVAARDLAQSGKKVLIVDMDLEAPGVGSMLLKTEQLPKYGMLDACVESALSPVRRDFLFDMVSASDFGGGKGLIDVVPAVGLMALEWPGNVLAKLARAYIESTAETDGTLQTFAQRTSALVDALCDVKRYDAVFIDARAGLNESTAPAILSLGAKVLLFGEDTPQTFAGYRFLLAHLSRFERGEQDDWLDRIHMVHAKASPLPEKQQMFRDRSYEIFREFLYQDDPLDDGVSLPEFTLDDVEAPHYAIPILRDSNYFEFDPLSDSSVMTTALYERTYDALLRRLNPSRSLDSDGK